jgi:hypothetical protein
VILATIEWHRFSRSDLHDVPSWMWPSLLRLTSFLCPHWFSIHCFTAKNVGQRERNWGHCTQRSLTHSHFSFELIALRKCDIDHCPVRLMSHPNGKHNSESQIICWSKSFEFWSSVHLRQPIFHFSTFSERFCWDSHWIDHWAFSELRSTTDQFLNRWRIVLSITRGGLIGNYITITLMRTLHSSDSGIIVIFA